MQLLAGVRIERSAFGLRLTPRPVRRWVAPVSLVAMLAGVAWLTVASRNGVAAFMAADFVLWCWVAGAAQWAPVHGLREALDIRAASDGYRGPAARDVVVDGRPVTGRIHGAAIAQVHARSRPPAL